MAGVGLHGVCTSRQYDRVLHSGESEETGLQEGEGDKEGAEGESLEKRRHFHSLNDKAIYEESPECVVLC